MSQPNHAKPVTAVLGDWRGFAMTDAGDYFEWEGRRGNWRVRRWDGHQMRRITKIPADLLENLNERP